MLLIFANLELPPLPRTSLDLELDLRAQHTKLETLNDEIEKLKNLKSKLEQAIDTKDGKVAAWAVENEDFQRLVEKADASGSPEDQKMKKLLHKTSKEIYKLRKTRLSKGQPDIVSFRYVFCATVFVDRIMNACLLMLVFYQFHREKIAFFTRKGLTVPDPPAILTEEPEEVVLPATPPSSSTNSSPDELNPQNQSKSDDADSNRFQYVVDRTYGVEV